MRKCKKNECTKKFTNSKKYLKLKYLFSINMTKSCSKNYAAKNEKFHCEFCDYSTCKLSSWKKHVLTKKHRSNKKKQNSKKCPFCEETLFSRTTLWRHKKKCEKNFLSFGEKQLSEHGFTQNSLKKGVKNAQKPPFLEEKKETKNQISELAIMMKELITNQNKLQQNMKSYMKNPQTINNNCNNSMTINMFLNNDCKNAMNLKDFVDGLKISWDDLDYTKNNGYINGISNIFVKQLQDLKPTERPIHCSDTDNLKFYYKDENKWEQDKQNQKMDESIKIITKKQMIHIKEWEQANPSYTDDPELLEEWHAMILCLMGGTDAAEIKTNQEEIKKKIGTTVNIEHLNAEKK